MAIEKKKMAGTCRIDVEPQTYGVYRYTKGIFEGGPVYSSSNITEADRKCKEYNARVTYLVNTKYVVESFRERADKSK